MNILCRIGWHAWRFIWWTGGRPAERCARCQAWRFCMISGGTHSHGTRSQIFYPPTIHPEE